jgi:hypothetical protein
MVVENLFIWFPSKSEIFSNITERSTFRRIILYILLRGIRGVMCNVVLYSSASQWDLFHLCVDYNDLKINLLSFPKGLNILV